MQSSSPVTLVSAPWIGFPIVLNCPKPEAWDYIELWVAPFKSRSCWAWCKIDNNTFSWKDVTESSDHLTGMGDSNSQMPERIIDVRYFRNGGYITSGEKIGNIVLSFKNPLNAFQMDCSPSDARISVALELTELPPDCNCVLLTDSGIRCSEALRVPSSMFRGNLSFPRLGGFYKVAVRADGITLRTSQFSIPNGAAYFLVINPETNPCKAITITVGGSVLCRATSTSPNVLQQNDRFIPVEVADVYDKPPAHKVNSCQYDGVQIGPNSTAGVRFDRVGFFALELALKHGDAYLPADCRCFVRVVPAVEIPPDIQQHLNHITQSVSNSGNSSPAVGSPPIVPGMIIGRSGVVAGSGVGRVASASSGSASSLGGGGIPISTSGNRRPMEISNNEREHKIHRTSPSTTPQVQHSGLSPLMAPPSPMPMHGIAPSPSLDSLLGMINHHHVSSSSSLSSASSNVSLASSIGVSPSGNVTGHKEAAKFECCVCTDAVICMKLDPCKHVCVCETCVRLLPRPLRCPICRRDVTSVEKVYLV